MENLVIHIPVYIKRDSYQSINSTQTYGLTCMLLIMLLLFRYGASSWPCSNFTQRALWWGRWREAGCLHTQHQLFGYEHVWLLWHHHPTAMLWVCRSWCWAWQLTRLIPSVSDVPLVIYLHGGYWQFLRYSPLLPEASELFCICTKIFFHADSLCTYSKEESGFMAVPLVDKGVVVVAVGYDIAPKGRVFSFLMKLCLLMGKDGSFKDMNW